MARRRSPGGTVGIPYMVFAYDEEAGLAYVGRSRALGADTKELQHLQRIHQLSPGDMVYLDKSWWYLGPEGWRPADPGGLDAPVYGGRAWDQTFASELLADDDIYDRTTIPRADAVRRKLPDLKRTSE